MRRWLLGAALSALLMQACSGTPAQLPTPPTRPATPEVVPSFAPDGRTLNEGLNAVIERLLAADAGELEQWIGPVDAWEARGGSGPDARVAPEVWTARLAGARRSLYAVKLAESGSTPFHSFDVVLAVAPPAGGEEGWRFAVRGNEVLDVRISEGHPSVAVAGRYDRFMVLPPVDDLPQPPDAYSFQEALSATRDAGVQELIRLLETHDGSGLRDAVSSAGAFPISQCDGTVQSASRALIDFWLGMLANEAYAIGAVVNVPAGYSPPASHLVVFVREAGPYDWREAGLLERDGEIVGLAIDCVSYPSTDFLLPPRR